jgi:hypothetical protein
MVPEAVAGGGRRAARLGAHGDRVGRRARGLEGALVDNESHRLRSLDPDDPREFDIRVARPGALMVAKLHKLVERTRERGAKRVKDKDATLTPDLRRLRSHSLSGVVTGEAIEHLAALFGSATAAGTQMVIRATELLEDPLEMARSCELLTREVLQALGVVTPVVRP